MEEDAERGGADGVIDVGVAKNDQRTLSPHLEREASGRDRELGFRRPRLLDFGEQFPRGGISALCGLIARGANPFSADIKIVVRYAINQFEGGSHSNLLGTRSLPRTLRQGDERIRCGHGLRRSVVKTGPRKPWSSYAAQCLPCPLRGPAGLL